MEQEPPVSTEKWRRMRSRRPYWNTPHPLGLTSKCICLPKVCTHHYPSPHTYTFPTSLCLFLYFYLLMTVWNCIIYDPFCSSQYISQVYWTWWTLWCSCPAKVKIKEPKPLYQSLVEVIWVVSMRHFLYRKRGWVWGVLW